MGDDRSWLVRRVTGPASVHHTRLPEPDRRLVRVVAVDGPALVLGSAQPRDVVDHAAVPALGAEVVRRRSGGGAVWLRPGDPLWVDVVVPAGDPLHHHDVGRAFLWLGDVWAAALGSLGLVGEVHRGPADRDAVSRLACFAGRGPGEVLVEGQKVVGISQRRTRAGAVFQCAVHERFDAAPLMAALGRADDDELAAALPARGTGLGAERVLDALLRHLPTT